MRRNMAMAVLGVLLVSCGPDGRSAPNTRATPAAGGVPGRVMIIGLDGTRADALALARAPNLQALISGGIADLDLVTGDVSLSGPGWSSLLTGVWCDKHGVIDNDLSWRRSSFDEYPHFMRRLEAARPELVTASVSHWAPINDEILCADEAGADCPADAVISPATDAGVRDEVVRLLREQDPHALFMQFDDIDHAGHGEAPFVADLGGGGFCPHTGGDPEYRGKTGACRAQDFNPAYLQTLELTDGYIGEILAALRSRPQFAAENWLVMVTADHGGGGTVRNEHGFSHPQDRRSFLVLQGASLAALPVAQLKLADVAATALVHLGVPLDPTWNLDGQPVGIVSAASYQEIPVRACADRLGLFPLLPL